MHFNQAVHAKLCRGFNQSQRCVVVHGCHDDENTICVPRAGFIDLVGVVEEVLAQAGQLASGARLFKIGRRTLKPWFVCQNRKASCSTCCVSLSQRRRIKIRTDEAFGGARFLDLGNEREDILLVLALKRLEKAARGGGLFNGAFKLGKRNTLFRRSDFNTLGNFNAGKNVFHGQASFEMRTSVSKVFWAAPLSIACSAWRAPSFSVFALPATTSPAAVFNTAISR